MFSIQGTPENRERFVCYFPGHALHEKGLHGQIAVGTIVRNLERRAPEVPRISRWSTAGQLLVIRGFCSSIGLLRNYFVRASRDTPKKIFFDRLEGTRVGTDLLASRPARPHPALSPCRAPPCHDPPVVCPGFEIDKWGFQTANLNCGNGTLAQRDCH